MFYKFIAFQFADNIVNVRPVYDDMQLFVYFLNFRFMDILLFMRPNRIEWLPR